MVVFRLRSLLARQRPTDRRRGLAGRTVLAGNARPAGRSCQACRMKWLTYLAILTALNGVGAEPKERPRLAAGAAGDDRRPSVSEDRSDRDLAAFADNGSFQAYLQAKSRRPVGLEAIPEVAAAKSEKAGTEKLAARGKDLATRSSAVVADADVLVLPKMEITAEKMTKLKAQLAELASRQALEERIAAKAAEPSMLDSILNPPFLRLGGYSSSASAALARKRFEVLDWIKVLTLSLAETKTPEDKKRIQADIDALNEMTRKWP